MNISIFLLFGYYITIIYIILLGECIEDIKEEYHYSRSWIAAELILCIHIAKLNSGILYI